MLPPLMLMKAGADHAVVLRALKMPRPCCPPITKPPLIVPGKTATPSALLSTEFGIALSGAPMISLNTVIES